MCYPLNALCRTQLCYTGTRMQYMNVSRDATLGSRLETVSRVIVLVSMWDIQDFTRGLDELSHDPSKVFNACPHG